MEDNYDYTQVQLPKLLSVMQAVLSGNNQLIQQATRFLKGYTKTKDSIKFITQILRTSPDVGIRQLATVLLKRNLQNLFKGLTQQQKESFKDILLNQFRVETSIQVQKGIAYLIGILLEMVELKNWTNLQHLFDTALAKVPDSIATLVLLNNLLYHFNPPENIVQYLFKCLQRQNLVEVALNCILAIVETQDEPNQSIITVIINDWQVYKWGEDLGYICVDILSIYISKKGKFRPQIVNWVCDNIIANQKFTDRIRNCGVDFLHNLFENQQKLITNDPAFLKRIIQTLCLVSSQPPRPKQQENGEELLQDVALWLVETFAIQIKQKKKIYTILLQTVTALIGSNQTYKMNTGFLVLAAMTEGCSQKIRKNLSNPIMNVLIPKGLENGAPQVRGAAINALCYFSQFLIPDIINYHSSIIDSMMKYINDLSHKVAEKALVALEIFFQNMQAEQICGYLNLVVPKLVQVLLDNKSTTLMKRASLSAIGSLITASEGNFQPYIEGIYKIILNILPLNPNPELNCIRAENLQVLGKLANQFCKQESPIASQFFEQCIVPNLQHIYYILVNQVDNQVRQACFSFFYLLANSIQNRFEFIFDKILAQVLKGCQAQLGQIIKKQQVNHNSLEDESQDQQQFNIKSTQLDQKAAAIHALGEFAKACPNKFSPYFKRSFTIVQNHLHHFYENLRIQSINCYQNLTLGYIRSVYNNVIPQYKQGLPCIQRFTSEIEEYFHHDLVPKLILIMTEDESSQVKSCAIQALTELTKQIGPALIDHNIQQIVNAIVLLLEGQSDQMDSQQQQNEQQEDTDVNILETLCDFIPRICKVLRSGFQPSFKQIFPSMMKYAQERQDINDNTSIVGSLSQCYKYLPGVISLTQQDSFPRLQELHLIGDQQLERNICYCIGIMFQNSSKSMQTYLNEGLILLKQAYEKNTLLAARENAIAGICRIIYTYNPPIPMQIFIQNTIKMLPFKDDQSEEKTVLKTFLYLSQVNGNILKPHLLAIKNILENDLKNVKKYKIKQPLLSSLSQFYINLNQLLTN